MRKDRFPERKKAIYGHHENKGVIKMPGEISILAVTIALWKASKEGLPRTLTINTAYNDM